MRRSRRQTPVVTGTLGDVSTPIVEPTHRAFEGMNRHDLDWLVAHEHMGYVIRGKVGFRSAAGEEMFEAGDAYYVGPGHTPILYAGTQVVEFSPTKELGETMEVVTKNMEQMEASA